MSRFFSSLLFVVLFAVGIEKAFAAYSTIEEAYAACSSSCTGSCGTYSTGNWHAVGCDISGSSASAWYQYYNGCTDTEFNLETGSCGPTPQTPDECEENSQYFNQADSSCSDTCDGSAINGFCFPSDTPDEFQDDSCNSSSSDYQGSIGYGSNQYDVCSGQSNCAEGETFGVVNGVRQCVNNDFGLPDCPEGQYAAVDDYGAGCNSFDKGAPNDPLPPPPPNTDTDADGTPDEYRPENDPNATTNAVNTVADGVSGLQDLQNEANDTADKTLSAIDRLRKDNNSRLDTLIDQGANPELPENAKLSEKSLIPTFEESASAFSAAVASNSAIQLVGNIVVPTSSTCPVYTLPSTPISPPITMDIHCSILANHSGLISSMFLFAWSLLGLTIFLKA